MAEEETRVVGGGCRYGLCGSHQSGVWPLIANGGRTYVM